MTHTKRLLISLAKSALIILLLTVFITFSIDIVPAVEPDEMASFPELYMSALSAVLYYITPIPFFAIALQFDTAKRKELLATYTGLPTKRKIMLETLRSFSFWSDTLCLLVPISAIGRLNAVSELILQGREVGWLVTFGLRLLCYALPLAAIFLYIESSIRRTWYREWEFASRTSKDAILDDLVREHPSYGMLALNIACIAGGTWLLPSIFWAVAAFFVTGVNILTGNALRILLYVIAFAVLFFLIRALKTVRARRKLFKELRKICADRGYKLTTKITTLRGLFYCTCREDFTVETPDKRYVGSILPIPSKNCALYFRLDYDGGGYNFKRAFLKYTIYFPRHKLDFSAVGASVSDKPTEKVLLLTREPADLLVGDRERTWRAHNGAHSGEYTVYDATAFCHYIDRMSL